MAWLIITPFSFNRAVLHLRGDVAVSQPALADAIQEAIQERSYWLIRFFDKDNIFFWLAGKKYLEGRFFYPPYEVSFNTHLLTRAVDLVVNKKEAQGVICTSVNCYGFDDNGKVFAEAPAVEGSLILKITDTDTATLPLGQSFLESEQWISNLLATVEILSAASWRWENIAIQPHYLREWVVELSRGPKLYFSLEFVPVNLKNILENFPVDVPELEYVDFRVSQRLYYQ